MSQADLSRIREDLATMKQAAGVGLPFGREDVRLSLAWAGAGLPVAALVAWTPVEPWVLAVLIGIPAALVLALTARVSKKYHRRRAQAPIRWREHRHQWVLAAIMVPPLGGFWIWAINKGLSPEALTAAAVFMAGLAYLIPPIVDRKRLLY